jgi:DNA-binding HxlR family transcriptional regulator
VGPRKEQREWSTPLKVEFQSCPVQASLGILGRKWAFLVLRDIELFGRRRFNEILRSTPGMSRRVLSMRLRELEREGYIKVVERGRNYSKWDLTEKGKDVLPVLMMLVRFGSKWYSEEVFKDKKTRTLREVFEESYIQEIMRDATIEMPVAIHASRNLTA